MSRKNNNRKNEPIVSGLRVIVEDGKFEKAMRLFKKKVDDSGLLKEIKERQAYVKPKTKRKIARNAARKRWEKYVESQQLPAKQY